jgi:hypothetical protein
MLSPAAPAHGGLLTKEKVLSALLRPPQLKKSIAFRLRASGSFWTRAWQGFLSHPWLLNASRKDREGTQLCLNVCVSRASSATNAPRQKATASCKTQPLEQLKFGNSPLMAITAIRQRRSFHVRHGYLGTTLSTSKVHDEPTGGHTAMYQISAHSPMVSRSHLRG